MLPEVLDSEYKFFRADPIGVGRELYPPFVHWDTVSTLRIPIALMIPPNSSDGLPCLLVDCFHWKRNLVGSAYFPVEDSADNSTDRFADVV